MTKKDVRELGYSVLVAVLGFALIQVIFRFF